MGGGGDAGGAALYQSPVIESSATGSTVARLQPIGDNGGRGVAGSAGRVTDCADLSTVLDQNVALQSTVPPQMLTSQKN